jgi:hypothetical protein
MIVYSMEKDKDLNKFTTVELDCDKQDFDHFLATGLFWNISN